MIGFLVELGKVYALTTLGLGAILGIVVARDWMFPR